MKFEKSEGEFGAIAQTSVADALASRGWAVYREPKYGSVQPDLVAVSESGEAFVIEIKPSRGGGTTTFADLAQTKAYEKAVGKALGVANVKALLVTNGEVSAAIESLGTDLGVRMIHAHDGHEAAEKVEYWTDH